MKKLTLKNGKAIACLILTFLFMVQACRKDSLMPSSNLLNKTISVEEAKQYFEQNILKFKPGVKLSSTGPIKSERNDGTDTSDDKLPMWDASKFRDLSIGTNAVLAPLHREGVYVHISNKKMVKYGFLNYLMMHKDADNKIITEWVELKPTEKWVDAKFSRNYDGKILVKDWDGKIKRIYTFNDGILVTTNKLKKNVLASLKGKTISSEQVCLVTTTVTIKTIPTRCPCMGHTYEQIGQCDCSVKPTHSYYRTVEVETTYDCEIPDEPIEPTPGGSGGTPGGPGNQGGGSPNPNDYTPLNCNPDPNYTVPTVPPPPGTEYILPCSELEIPTEEPPLPSDEPIEPKSSADLLVEWFNNDPDAQLHLSDNEIAYLYANPTIASELLNTTFSEAKEVKEFTKWAIAYSINNGYSEYVTSLLNGVYENQPDADAESTFTNFSFDNIETNFAFSSNGVNVYGNSPALPDYPSNHPVSAAITAYNPWIYLAFSNSNNTSIRHFHKQVKGLAGSDGWGKSIGAIGEGLAASRITSWPTSPGFQYRVGFMAGTTHLDGLQWGVLFKTSTGIGWGLNVVNSDLNGNEVITKMEEPDGPEVFGQKMARISYEIKTISPYNDPAYLWASFSEGIKQAEHRANSSGISASVLVFDTDSFLKLKNSTYGPQLLNRLATMFSRKNDNGEQKVYLRLEKSLYADARSSYFALAGRIKNLSE
ncbi:hypothetical protein OC25_23185 [Pedobacter kyungheensis]|uniref:Uncharacterized protein n=1 Tax=Pedobacter kyungheensis TaxID=1069985 RepID=A0A0C1FGW7_9SPHI|nr:hypothetical protein [Pedobacter kyungheensis]KIA91048.1 hypothetical protein OC25_23185 [Pedobacter kyungheensis]